MQPEIIIFFKIQTKIKKSTNMFLKIINFKNLKDLIEKKIIKKNSINDNIEEPLNVTLKKVKIINICKSLISIFFLKL